MFSAFFAYFRMNGQPFCKVGHFWAMALVRLKPQRYEDTMVQLEALVAEEALIDLGGPTTLASNPPTPKPQA